MSMSGISRSFDSTTGPFDFRFRSSATFVRNSRSLRDECFQRKSCREYEQAGKVPVSNPMKAAGHSSGVVHRELPKPSKELIGVRSQDELRALLLVTTPNVFVPLSSRTFHVAALRSGPAHHAMRFMFALLQKSVSTLQKIHECEALSEDSNDQMRTVRSKLYVRMKIHCRMSIVRRIRPSREWTFSKNPRGYSTAILLFFFISSRNKQPLRR